MPELAKKIKSAEILVFTTFNYFIIIQYKIFFKMRDHNIFRDNTFLTYWDIDPWGMGGNISDSPHFGEGHMGYISLNIAAYL